ncbi:MAG TPA: SMI1/KNR4 family protein [Aggregatilineaceae bacterium]|nr:SMI1/KNR4 family protein [Aggregatilineaceae bacterium]
MSKPLSVDQRVRKIERSIPSHLVEGGRKGCTAKELEELREAQNVECLPEVYRQFMFLMGRQGIARILRTIATCQDLITEASKEKLIQELDMMGMRYPRDIFVFAEDGEHYMFFRTKKCQDDPSVYGFWYEGYFHKLADSITDYFIQTVRESDQIRENALAKKINEVDFYYDPVIDDFYGVLPFAYDLPLPIERIIEKLNSRYGNKLEGCTAKELEELRETQNVERLPEVYRQFMLLMGKQGIGEVLGAFGEFTVQQASEFKRNLIMKLDRVKVLYPNDIFVFFEGYRQDRFYFFRTKDEGEKDPIIYCYFDGSDYFRKMSDTLSQFILQELDPSEYRRKKRWTKRQEEIFVYNPQETQMISS